MNQRTDPSSLSFGRRVAALESLTINQAKQIKDLKEGSLSLEEKLSAKELAAAKRSERNRANQVLASYDSTLDDLNSLNQTMLTSAQREQVRHNKNSLQAAQAQGSLVQFNSDALTRMDNWKQFAATNPVQQDFTKNNTLPGQPKPQRAFDLWKSRQDSPEGRFHRNQQLQQELERDIFVKQAEAQRYKPKAKGKRLGGLKDLNE